jgi:transposase
VKCQGCGKYVDKAKNYRYLKCLSCRESAKKENEEPVRLYERDLSSKLTTEQRWAIVLLHKQGKTTEEIASSIPCNINTAYHWIDVYNKTSDVNDEHRSGRKRKTTESQDELIVSAAVENPFVTPRQIIKENDLEVSARTARRRLNEIGLRGRVAAKENLGLIKN